jgi:polyisoprenoid-binding protein YceI
MNRTPIRLALALMIAAAGSVGALSAQPLAVKARGTKKIVLSNRVGANQFTWSSDAPLEKIQGTAEGVSGSLTLDPKNPASLRGTISAKVMTMKSGNDMRDEHLRGESWLDAAKHPEITFVATSVSGVKASGNSFTANVTGSFTMHGVTKTMTVPVTVQYLDASSRTKSRAPGDLVMLTAEFNVPLKDFNVAGSKGTVGSKVGESIAITAKLFGSTAL